MKFLKFSLIVMMGMLLVGIAAADPPTNGLVAYYPFDGNLNDASGNGLNGTAAGTGTFTFETTAFSTLHPQFGTMAHFPLDPGTGLPSGGITVPNNALLNFGTGDFSIAFWYRPGSGADVTADMTIFEKAPGGATDVGLKFRLQGSYAPAPTLRKGNQPWGSAGYGPLPFRSRSIPEGGASDYRVEFSYYDASTHHVVIMRDNALWPGAIYVWLDGIRWDSVNLVNGQTTGSSAGTFDHDCSSNADAAIGFSPIDTGDPVFGGSLNGWLDDLRIYNRALSQAEIDAIIVGPPPLPTPVPTSAVLLIENEADAPNHASDLAVQSRLEQMGAAVTVLDDDAVLAATGETTGKDLIVISSTVGSAKVSTKYRDSAVPVITWEPALYDEFNISPPFPDAAVQGDNTLTIINAAHPLAAGLSGTVTVYSQILGLTFGTPSAAATGAINIATLAGPQGAATWIGIIGYDTGGMMENGFTAPARRVGIFLNDNMAISLTNDGWALFEAAVNWAVPPPPPPNAVREWTVY